MGYLISDYTVDRSTSKNVSLKMIFSPFDTLFDYLNTHLFSYSHFYFLILSLSQEMICQSCMKALDSRLGSRVQELFIVNLFNFFVSQFIFLSLFFSFSIFDIF